MDDFSIPYHLAKSDISTHFNVELFYEDYKHSVEVDDYEKLCKYLLNSVSD